MKPIRLKHTFQYLGFIATIISLMACVGSEGEAPAQIEFIEETATTNSTKTLIPTPTIAPTPTLSPKQQEAIELFDAKAMGFEATYGLEVVVLNNGATALKTPFDAENDAHFIFDAEANRWINNHPGRIEIDAIMPEKTATGRNIYYELQGFKWDEENQKYSSEFEPANVAVWDQEHLAYRYVNTDADPGHDHYFEPMMALRDNDDQDIDEGRVTFVETVESEDFVLGKSGIKISYFLSGDFPDVKWWENKPADLYSQIVSEAYLAAFPELKGKFIKVRIVARDLTASGTKIPHRETFFQEEKNRMADGWVTGLMPDVVPDVYMITTSINQDNLGSRSASATDLSTLWAFRVHKDGVMSEDVGNEGLDIQSKVIYELMDESGLSGPETIHVELK